MLEPQPKHLDARSLKFEYRLHSPGFNKSFKINCTISTWIPNLGVRCKKWSNLTSGVGKNIWLRRRLVVLLGIRLQPKTADPSQLRLRNPMKTAHTPATAENEKRLRIQVWLSTIFWVRRRVQKKNAESCRSRLRVRGHLWCGPF